MDTRERVARAIFGTFVGGKPSEYYLEKADAAIEAHKAALREPTEKMLQAGGRVRMRTAPAMGAPRDPGPQAKREAGDIFQAMLAAEE